MKTRKDKIKIIAVALLVCASLFGISCADSKSSESADNKIQASLIDVGGEENVVMDLSPGLTYHENGDYKLVENDWFVITLPAADTWDYHYDDETGYLEIFAVNSRREYSYGSEGGVLVSIHAVEPGDTSYREWSQFWDLGYADGKLIVANFPTDVQWDMESEQAEKEYMFLDDITRKDMSWFQMK